MNKKEAFDQYKDKWGLSNYTFMTVQYYNHIVVIPNYNAAEYDQKLNIISSVHTLIKRRHNRFELRESNSKIGFDNLNELLEYMLIQKLAFGKP